MEISIALSLKTTYSVRWVGREPNRNPEYALIATWIGTQGAVAKALVMERKSSQLYYVARGEKVGDAIVENIAANQVSLKDSNDIVTLKAEAIQFLSSSSGSGERSGERRRFCS